MKKHKRSAKEIVDALDLPHKRVPGWEWKKKGSAPINKSEFSKSRLEFYAQSLLDLGMLDGDVSGLLSDLYWDSYEEAYMNNTFEKLDFYSL
jgi:hypothetical protein